jgi:hypothetical protein
MLVFPDNGDAGMVVVDDIFVSGTTNRAENLQ